MLLFWMVLRKNKLQAAVLILIFFFILTFSFIRVKYPVPWLLYQYKGDYYLQVNDGERKSKKTMFCLNQQKINSPIHGAVINLPKPIVCFITQNLTTPPAKVFAHYHTTTICIVTLLFELVVGHQSSQQNAHSQVCIYFDSFVLQNIQNKFSLFGFRFLL